MYFKSILLFSGTALIVLLASLASSSCSNATNDNFPPGPDTIHLETSVPFVQVQVPDSAKSCTLVSDSIQIWLSCGCPFTLNQTGSGGDIAAFSDIIVTPDSNRVTPHYLRFQYIYNRGAMQDSAWFAFSSVDYFGNTKCDTVRVSGYFK